MIKHIHFFKSIKIEKKKIFFKHKFYNSEILIYKYDNFYNDLNLLYKQNNKIF